VSVPREQASAEALLLIDGQLTTGSGREWIESVNPANEAVLGRAAAASAADVESAVQAAQRAQPAWAALTVWERAGKLRALAQTIRARGAEILKLEASDTGNTIGKLRADVEIAAGYLEYFAGLASEMKGETIPASARGLHFTVRQPYGVVARIVPFNHPFMFAAAHLAAPLLAGNTVVLKTPETSPLTGGLLAELCAALPPGVVNIVHGYGMPAGDALVRHPAVRRIGFTGSVATGLAIQRAAAASGVKHVSLELGGKNPLIIFPDADLDRAVDAAIAGMNFSWAGQSCGSTSRMLVHASIYREIVDRVAARMRAIKLGDPLDPSSEMGPVNSSRQYERVMGFIQRADAAGLRRIVGGGRPAGAQFERGFWVEPTFYADVPPSAELAQEEVFGPILCAMPFRDEADAVALANNSEHGLTTSVWTRDLGRSLRLIKSIESGVVWINATASHFVGAPFGGWKNSGLGSEECLEELLSYTQLKAAHVFE
jgi:betaine-aldehyde dehydrogenase